MEFSEKLQQLRKNANLTQEQLAAKLYVSRTAVSKWETGGGYPNLDSLKDIARVFGTSVDALLSGEELLGYADAEANTKSRRLLGVVFGTFDIIALSFFFLPLFGEKNGDFIAMVPLVSYAGPNSFLSAFSIAFLLLAALGIAELASSLLGKERLGSRLMIASVAVHACAVLAFNMTQQPYATGLLFLFLCAKVFLLIYQRSKLISKNRT